MQSLPRSGTRSFRCLGGDFKKDITVDCPLKSSRGYHLSRGSEIQELGRLKKKGEREEGRRRGLEVSIMRTLVSECNLIEDREELLPADVQPRRVADASCYQDNNGERLTLLFLVACANYLPCSSSRKMCLRSFVTTRTNLLRLAFPRFREGTQRSFT